MTEAELEELLSDSPTLFHMAEGGSWPSIRERGLLSTTALLDLYGVSGDPRKAIEERRRGTSISINREGLPEAVIRDQIPMTDEGLVRALPKRLSPADWYRLLNKKVFFWLTPERLSTLLNAGTYRARAHDVIEVDSKALVDSYRNSIWFCPMNSGSTKPFPHPRDEATFQRLATYPYASWRPKRRRGERVVELAIDYAIPDVSKFVRRVVRMQGDEEQSVLFKS